LIDTGTNTAGIFLPFCFTERKKILTNHFTECKKESSKEKNKPKTNKG